MAPRPRPYDKFMVSYKIGADPALRRIPSGQRWVWVGGVLALAAQSPIRGHLVVPGDVEPVTVSDIAKEASVSKGTAEKAIAHFRRVELIKPDDELPGYEYVPNFRLYNPMPPASSTEGERFRKREQRTRERIARRAVQGALA
jgi:hypothetical protein